MFHYYRGRSVEQCPHNVECFCDDVLELDCEHPDVFLH